MPPFRGQAPSPIPGTVGPSFAPSNLPYPRSVGVESPGGVGPFKVRDLVGVNIAFGSPALTDQPLWIRIDAPGTF